MISISLSLAITKKWRWVGIKTHHLITQKYITTSSKRVIEYRFGLNKCSQKCSYNYVISKV